MSHMITLPRDSSIRNLGEKDMQFPSNCAHPTDNSDSIRKATIAHQQRLTAERAFPVYVAGRRYGLRTPGMPPTGSSYEVSAN